MVRARWILVFLLALPAALLHAEEPATPPPVEEEPELEGEAKRQHEREVKARLKELEGEPNRALVVAHIERMATEGTRVARDALIGFVKGNKNQEHVAKAFTAPRAWLQVRADLPDSLACRQRPRAAVTRSADSSAGVETAASRSRRFRAPAMWPACLAVSPRERRSRR